MADHINGSLDDHERGAFLCGSQDEKHGKVGEALSCQRGSTYVETDTVEELDKRVSGALKPCETQAKVEETFELFRVTDAAQKIAYLRDCLGNPLIFFSDSDPGIESRYLTFLSMFLSGEWKLYE